MNPMTYLHLEHLVRRAERENVQSGKLTLPYSTVIYNGNEEFDGIVEVSGTYEVNFVMNVQDIQDMLTLSRL